MKKIIYKNNYISLDFVNEIREYFNKINDSLFASKGPYLNQKTKLGWQGCWDRNLHYEKSDSPIHRVVSKLKEDLLAKILKSAALLEKNTNSKK